MYIRGKPTLKRVTRIDSIPAGSTSFDEQGFLHDTPVVTSVGVFEYALPEGGVRRELRLPEHVFDKESLASYAGKPVIITHEAGAIDKDNVMEEIVGTILSEGFRDGQNVRCKVVIHDIDKVKKTPYRELSLGYNLDLIEEPGEWNGEPYDAIQTNIRINHLAIVENARAGEQAHLNLDGRKVKPDDKTILKGGNKKMDENNARKDNIALTPEELAEAIRQYKAVVKPEDKPASDGGDSDAGVNAFSKENDGTDTDVPVADTLISEPTVVAEPAVHKKKNQDDSVGKLISLLEGFLNELKTDNAAVADKTSSASPADEEHNTKDGTDCPGDKPGSINNDSADEVFRQRLSICRMGDRLDVDGLENKSITEGKKAIINKVFPEMRLDGKDKSYVDAAYDLAVNAAGKRKDVAYQKQQMSGKPAPQQRADGQSGSNAAAARQRMIEREGGN